MGKKEKKQSEQLSLQQQKISNQLLQADIKRQEDIFQQIKPLTDFLLKMGVDPISFFQTPQGAALLAPQRAALGENFDQQRMNAIDLFAGTGFSPGSGQAAGPLANLFGQEATAQSNLLYNNIGNALNLGLQGGNLLQGQQAVFNPFQAAGIGSNAAQNIAEGGGIWKAIIGAAGTALGGLNPLGGKK